MSNRKMKMTRGLETSGQSRMAGKQYQFRQNQLPSQDFLIWQDCKYCHSHRIFHIPRSCALPIGLGATADHSYQASLRQQSTQVGNTGLHMLRRGPGLTYSIVVLGTEELSPHTCKLSSDGSSKGHIWKRQHQKMPHLCRHSPKPSST